MKLSSSRREARPGSVELWTAKNRQPALWLVESGENENQIEVEDALAEQA